MADISTFPAIQDVLVSGNNIREYTATEAITKGQVVGFAATGVADAVVPMDATAEENTAGVAITTATIGMIVKVAGPGCIVKVANESTSVAIEAGEYVQQSAVAVKGTVVIFTPRADLVATIKDTVDDTVADSRSSLVGVTQTVITANGSGNMLILPSLMLYSDSTIV